MKFALLSDIHSNFYAIEAVLLAVKKRNIQKLIITGDFVGYYFWPQETLNLLDGWDVTAIAGNHDRMLKKAIHDAEYKSEVSKKYGSGLNVAIDELDGGKIKWLMDMPDSLKLQTKHGCILLCHGSPWDVDEYIYPDLDEISLVRYSNLNVKWVVQGHTHYSMKQKVGAVTIINPGSVGQPRNRRPGAQWALLDTKLNKIDFFCEQYDMKIVIEESKKRHPDIPYLANILERT